MAMSSAPPRDNWKTPSPSVMVSGPGLALAAITAERNDGQAVASHIAGAGSSVPVTV